MGYDIIRKGSLEDLTVRPNLDDYEAMRASFRWEDIHSELDFLPGGGLNLAHEAIDRHLATERRDKVALIWDGKGGVEERYTFADLSRLSNRFANVLTGLGIAKGDRAFTYLDRVPEAYVSITFDPGQNPPDRPAPLT